MKPLPGALPKWMAIPPVVSLTHFFGQLTLLAPWFAIGARYLDIPVTGIDPVQCLGLFVGTPVTLIAAGLTALFTGRAKSTAGALVASVFGSAVTFAAGGAAYAYHLWANLAWGEHFDDILIGDRFYGSHLLRDVLISGIAGFLVGALAGLVLARPAMWLTESARRGNEVASGRTLVGVGVWMLLPGFLSLGAVLARGGDPLPAAIAALASWGLSLAFAAAGALLLRRRARWLEAVRQGQVPRYRVREAEASDASLPRIGTETRADDEVLEEVLETPDAPYRAAKLATPIARVTRR